jgi:hypothetical protein
MNAHSPNPADARIVTGFGLRSNIARRLGVALFVAGHAARALSLLELDVRLNPTWSQGFAVPAVILNVVSALSWFALTQRGSFLRWAVLLLVFAFDTWIVARCLMGQTLGPAAHTVTAAALTCGFWAAPLAVILCGLRGGGLRVVGIGESIRIVPAAWKIRTAAIQACAVWYVASFAAWLWLVHENERQMDWRILVYPALICAVGAIFKALAVPAALAHQKAPLWFCGLTAAVLAVWFVIIAGYLLRSDLTWIRIRRDSSAALLGYVPYVQLLWFRVLGYRVEFVAA